MVVRHSVQASTASLTPRTGTRPGRVTRLFALRDYDNENNPLHNRSEPLMTDVQFIVTKGDELNVPDPCPANDAIARASAKVAAGQRSRILLYIHGRAAKLIGDSDREPRKSFKQERIVEQLERDYRQAVVMLRWPHDGSVTGFPDGDARAAWQGVQTLLTALGTVAPTAQVGLITHSMGSIVLEEFVARTDSAPLSRLQNIVISSPASRYSGSGVWLGKIPIPCFVTMNRDDKVLDWIEKTHDPLGLRDATSLAAERAANAVYLDVAALKVGHRYFVAGSGQSPDDNYLRDVFFGPLMAGNSPRYEQLVATSQANVWRTKKSMNPSDSDFSNGGL